MYYFLLIPVVLCFINYKSLNDFFTYEKVYLYPKNPISINLISKENVLNIIEKINNYNDDEITFFINSNGGDVIAGYDLITNMELFKKMDITFNCYALKAASMAFDIFQHCDSRYVMSNSYLFQHLAMINGNWTMEELQYKIDSGYFNKIIRINNELDTYSSNKLNMKYENYKDLIKDNLILKSGEEILDLNCADDIVKILDISIFEF